MGLINYTSIVQSASSLVDIYIYIYLLRLARFEVSRQGIGLVPCVSRWRKSKDMPSCTYHSHKRKWCAQDNNCKEIDRIVDENKQHSDDFKGIIELKKRGRTTQDVVRDLKQARLCPYILM